MKLKFDFFLCVFLFSFVGLSNLIYFIRLRVLASARRDKKSMSLVFKRTELKVNEDAFWGYYISPRTHFIIYLLTVSIVTFCNWFIKIKKFNSKTWNDL